MVIIDNLTEEELRKAYNLYMKRYRDKNKEQVKKYYKKYNSKRQIKNYNMVRTLEEINHNIVIPAKDKQSSDTESTTEIKGGLDIWN